ncbi:hypothetical protein [uncultured Jannaschia sp.]|uniref:hypothetical protein n=1 Tax=uncultured Jannaschia sp. TaxID=293347 RepID=UPI00260AB025|nr:hypothetical protein [uncultured Jannaschia sp.]
MAGRPGRVHPMLGQPRNPLSLSEKAARYGAVALLVGVLIIGWPIVEGYRIAGAGMPMPPEGDGWQELRRFGWDYGMSTRK